MDPRAPAQFAPTNLEGIWRDCVGVFPERLYSVQPPLLRKEYVRHEIKAVNRGERAHMGVARGGCDNKIVGDWRLPAHVQNLNIFRLFVVEGCPAFFKYFKCRVCLFSRSSGGGLFSSWSFDCCGFFRGSRLFCRRLFGCSKFAG